jgi:hypothetical protein
MIAQCVLPVKNQIYNYSSLPGHRAIPYALAPFKKRKREKEALSERR